MTRYLRRALTYLDDPRNDDVLVYIDGQFFPRDQAMVSVYDNGFALGDGLWEMLRLVHGRVAFRDAHLDRLIAGAAVLGFVPLPTRAALAQAIDMTLHSNEMFDEANIRLMVTRGPKRAPDQDPRTALSPPTVVVIVEFRVFRPRFGGLALATSELRYPDAESCDLRLKSQCQISNVQALMQASEAGADMALMLDRRGFVASCNAANIFIVHHGELWTPTGDVCFRGITRQQVIAAWRGAGGTVRELDFIPAEIMAADEVFITGTADGVTPVAHIDGQTVGSGAEGQVTAAVMRLYEAALRAG